jgi:hypothetical protein
MPEDLKDLLFMAKHHNALRAKACCSSHVTFMSSCMCRCQRDIGCAQHSVLVEWLFQGASWQFNLAGSAPGARLDLRKP